MKKKILIGSAATVAVFMIIYTVFIYFLVSACLVPSFMEKLDAFEDITKKGYSEQVHTSDISENRREMLTETKAWLDYMLEQDEQAQIVLHGQSMGAATALIMTGQENLPKQVKAVVADCAYTSAYEMFGDKITEWFGLPAFPFVDSACLMLRLRGGYNLKNASAIDAVKRSETPTLFIHGEKDAMIDVKMSEELYEAAACAKELLIVEGAGHAQSQDKSPEKYYGAITRFLADCEL